MQENHFNTIFVVGHNPQVTEFAKMMTGGAVSKIPALGVVAINFDIEGWNELQEAEGKVDFFIYPKQFKYYMPKQIRSALVLS